MLGSNLIGTNLTDLIWWKKITCYRTHLQEPATSTLVLNVWRGGKYYTVECHHLVPFLPFYLNTEKAYNKRHLVSSLTTILSIFVALNNILVMYQQIMVNFCYSSCCYWTVTEIGVAEQVPSCCMINITLWLLSSYQPSGPHNSRKQMKSWKELRHGFSPLYNCRYSCFYCSISKSCSPCRLRADLCWEKYFSASVSYLPC